MLGQHKSCVIRLCNSLVSDGMNGLPRSTQTFAWSCCQQKYRLELVGPSSKPAEVYHQQDAVEQKSLKGLYKSNTEENLACGILDHLVSRERSRWFIRGILPMHICDRVLGHHSFMYWFVRWQAITRNNAHYYQISIYLGGSGLNQLCDFRCPST